MSNLIRELRALSIDTKRCDTADVRIICEAIEEIERLRDLLTDAKDRFDDIFTTVSR